MADGKWIPDLAPTTPLADAARHVLTVRLDVVRHHLPLALHEADKDPEHVHQLRVATRRAGAALRIFVDCLPEQAYDAGRKQLRKLRRAAGDVRDWDVFLIMLKTWCHEQGERRRAGADFVIGYTTAQRETAQAHLVETAADYPFTFDRFLAETVAAVHRPRNGGLRRLIDLARPLLSALLQELDRAAERDLDDYGNLHQVRIAGKRLRYAMEVFADCFAEPFRTQLYPQVEEMQEILGHANDSHVAAGRLGSLRDRLRATQPDQWKRYCLGIEALLRYHLQQLPRERKRFSEWWKRWHETGVEAALAELLHSPVVNERSRRTRLSVRS
jgi:CHAD domain-containing protein